MTATERYRHNKRIAEAIMHLVGGILVLNHILLDSTNDVDVKLVRVSPGRSKNEFTFYVAPIGIRASDLRKPEKYKIGIEVYLKLKKFVFPLVGLNDVEWWEGKLKFEVIDDDSI